MAMIPRNTSKPAADTAAAATTATAAAPAAQATATATASAPAADTATAAAAPASTSTAVAQAPSHAISAKVNGKPVPVMKEEYKDKLPLEWNTLHRIQCNQGQFLDMEDNKKPIGGVIEMELMTFQDSFQISPGSNDPQAKELVRYSDDGKTTNKGEDCQQYLEELRANDWKDAKMSPRVVLAGVLTKCNNPALIGKMVQIDLSQTSKSQFDRHQLQISFDVAKGIKTRDHEQIGFLQMTAVPRSKGDKSWTECTFSYAQAPVAA